MPKQFDPFDPTPIVPLRIREWSDEFLINELRSNERQALGPEGYHLIIAEALARLLEARSPEN